ncbi:MAG: hypothetical protein KBT33_01085 [Prevotellaceae bacterium]|nr:hypothetical protein [Candidatus Minthosoma equi]
MKKKEYKMPQAIVVAVNETELLVESPIGFGEGPGSGNVGANMRNFESFEDFEDAKVWDDDIFSIK